MEVKRDIVVIGASAGGVEALREVVRRLPGDFPGTVFVVMHLLAGATSFLPSILSRASALPVKHAENNEVARRGTIYVAPPDQHMFVEGERILVVRGPRENRARPAINPLFRSAALSFGPRVVGVILTGMLDDGTAGLWAVKRRGGVAIVQRPEDALFAEMPQSALDNVEIDHTLPLAAIPATLVQLASTAVQVAEPSPAPDFVRVSNDGTKMILSPLEADLPGRRSVFSCPDCGGALWEYEGDGPPQFHCHVGHAYSPLALIAAGRVTIEESLWTAVRALKESAAVHERMADRTAAQGLHGAAAAYRRQAVDKHRQAEQVLETLRALGQGNEVAPEVNAERRAG